MAEKKGLFKRMFSFGRKKDDEPAEETVETLTKEGVEESAPQAELAKAEQEMPEQVDPVKRQAETAGEPEPSEEEEPDETETSLLEKDTLPDAIFGDAPEDAPAGSAEAESESNGETIGDGEPATAGTIDEPLDTGETTNAEAEPPAQDDVPSDIPSKPEIQGEDQTTIKPSPVNISDGKVTILEPRKRDETVTVEEQRSGWLARLGRGLSRSSSALTGNIASVFTTKKLDEDTLQDLEDVLIQADLGVETAMKITEELASQRIGKDVSEKEVRQIMADEIASVLKPVAQPLQLDLSHKPHVVLVVGVNGSGKTTTIGKLSNKLHDAGLKTLLVAGDTFRAAAIEQLKIWGARTKAKVVARDLGADAASLAFDAWKQAKDEGADVMLMDTAGRLQNKKELMDELEKIVRVLKKHDPDAPHTVLLTLDATTGQNAMNQVEIFKNVAGVNGLVMTKLDGTARGGILVAIAAKHKLPVFFIGVGEQVEDLEPFEAEDFARSIAGFENTQEADLIHDK